MALQRLAVVTGANRGLGLHFVDQLQRHGWRVAATCRTPDSATALAKLAPEAIVALDVADSASIAAFADDLRRQVSSVELLINNAGVMSASAAPVDDRPDDDAAANGPLAHLDAAAMTALMSVNSVGPVMVTQALAGLLSAGSKVINLSSRLGSIAVGSTSDYGYGMSKAALNMATTLIARELAPRGIVTVAVSPGWVRTDMGGASASLSPEESTRSIVELVERLGPADNGTFVDHLGAPVPW